MSTPPSILEIIVCETCRFPDGEAEKNGLTGGQTLAEAVRADVAATPVLKDQAVVSTHRCLMACKRACTLHIRTAGRMGYILGDLSPDRNTTKDLSEYFKHYLETQDGIVPFRQWPPAVKGHFVARVPALPAPKNGG